MAAYLPQPLTSQSAVSYLCWRFVEEPARRHGARLARRQGKAVDAASAHRGSEAAGAA